MVYPKGRGSVRLGWAREQGRTLPLPAGLLDALTVAAPSHPLDAIGHLSTASELRAQPRLQREHLAGLLDREQRQAAVPVRFA